MVNPTRSETPTARQAPDIPPYLPKLRWYAVWSRAKAEGLSEREAIVTANCLTGVKGKDFARTCLPGHVLSVAIEGGAGRLKKGAWPEFLRLSLHGNWPHVHLGTIEALYGRTPYYQHLADDLRSLFSDPPMQLSLLNSWTHRILTSWIQIPPSDTVKKGEARGKELLEKVNPDLSVIDALMRLGPEVSLLLPLLR